MATAADLAAIDAAIASAVLEVRAPDGRTVKYRSMPELLAARATVAASLDAAAFVRTTGLSFNRD